MADNKKLLIMIDWYEPGFKAGGPIRSIVSFVQNMKTMFDIYVLTTDRDLNATEPYPGIKPDTWLFVNGHHVNYLSPGNLGYKNIRKKILGVAPDTVYLNSMFSLPFTIFPLIIARSFSGKVKVVLAPRGMLKQSALNFKKTKKQIFLFLGKNLGYYKNIWFHATSEDEIENVQALMGISARVKMIPNFAGYVPEFQKPSQKLPGIISLLFLGRIHPIKNLDYLLKQLNGIHGEVTLNVLGSAEDKPYQQECIAIIKTLPSNIVVNFIGEMEYNEVQEQIMKHHLMVLPTRGENFGHAIFEALRAGKPVIISDQTPWLNLEQKKAGWSLSLTEPLAFTKALQRATDFDQETYDEWSNGAWNLVKEYVSKTNLNNEYENLLN